MRADARKNYDRLLDIARDIFSEQGAEASMRDIARKGEVGLGTLYRHFPSREALFDALLRSSFDALTAKAKALETADAPDEALVLWLREIVAVAHSLQGVIAAMVASIADPQSALHESCVTMRASGAQLLQRAQACGLARADLDGEELFALVSALAWLNDQPALASRVDHLFDVITSAILVKKDA